MHYTWLGRVCLPHDHPAKFQDRCVYKRRKRMEQATVQTDRTVDGYCSEGMVCRPIPQISEHSHIVCMWAHELHNLEHFNALEPQHHLVVVEPLQVAGEQRAHEAQVVLTIDDMQVHPSADPSTSELIHYTADLPVEVDWDFVSFSARLIDDFDAHVPPAQRQRLEPAAADITVTQVVSAGNHEPSLLCTSSTSDDNACEPSDPVSLHHDDLLHIDVSAMPELNFVLDLIAFDLRQFEPPPPSTGKGGLP